MSNILLRPLGEAFELGTPPLQGVASHMRSDMLDTSTYVAVHCKTS
jgi:hypothetical protein